MTDFTSSELSPNGAQAADSGSEFAFRRKPRLTSVRGVRREMASLYVDLLHGRVSQKVAGTANGILCGIARTLESQQLEERIDALEKRDNSLPEPQRHPQ